MNLDTLIEKAEKKLSGVHAEVAAKALELVRRCHAKGINILITQGYRSIAEQNALYAQGRTKPGNIVTNAKGGSSIHNYGLAFDFAVYGKDGKTIDWNTGTDTNSDGAKDYFQVGAIGKSIGLEWGGDWRSFKDYPHFEYTFGLTLSQLKAGKRPPGGSYAAASTSMTKSEVLSLQKLLNLAAVDPRIDEDGIWGAQTEAAVKQFQRRAGLAVDGIAGPNTLNKLKAVTRETVKEETPVAEKKISQTPSPRFAEQVAWAKSNGISDGSNPQEPITREQVMTMIYNDNKRKGTL